MLGFFFFFCWFLVYSFGGFLSSKKCYIEIENINVSLIQDTEIVLNPESK